MKIASDKITYNLLILRFFFVTGAPVSNARLRYHSQAAAEHETALAGIL